MTRKEIEKNIFEHIFPSMVGYKFLLEDCIEAMSRDIKQMNIATQEEKLEEIDKYYERIQGYIQLSREHLDAMEEHLYEFASVTISL